MSPSHADFDIVDFHSHHIPTRFEQTAVRSAPANQRARWEALAPRRSDEDFLLKDIREGDIAARVVNIPAQLIADTEGCVPHETIRTMILRRLSGDIPAAFTDWRRSMPMTATGRPGRLSAPSAISDCAVFLSTARAAMS